MSVMWEELTVTNVTNGVLVFVAFVVVVVVPIFSVVVVYVSTARRKRRTRGMQAAADALGLVRNEHGWAGGQIEGHDVSSKLFVSRWGPSRGRDFIQTTIHVTPAVRGRLVVFNGCIHSKAFGVMPWIGDWRQRPLPDGGTLVDGQGGKGGHLVPVKTTDADFEKHFHVFAVDPDGARALLEGDSTRALAAARRPSEYFWFDGETLQLLVDLDDRDRGAGFDWPAELHAQRERAAHVAATIAERVRTLSR